MSRKARPSTKGAPALRDRDRQGGDGGREPGQRSPAPRHRRRPVQTIDVGAPVAWIYAEGEAVGAIPSGASAAAPAEPSPPPPAAVVNGAVAPTTAQGIRATPIARRLAREAGVELVSVTGSGPHGRIQREDVEKRLKRPAGSPPRPRLSGQPGPRRRATSSFRPARAPARRSFSSTASRATPLDGCRSSASCRATCRSSASTFRATASRRAGGSPASRICCAA